MYKIPKYADTELKLFEDTVHNELKPMVEEAKGNQFAQSIYNGVTIKANKSKYQSIKDVTLN